MRPVGIHNVSRPNEFLREHTSLGRAPECPPGLDGQRTPCVTRNERAWEREKADGSLIFERERVRQLGFFSECQISYILLSGEDDKVVMKVEKFEVSEGREAHDDRNGRPPKVCWDAREFQLIRSLRIVCVGGALPRG